MVGSYVGISFYDSLESILNMKIWSLKGVSRSNGKEKIDISVTEQRLLQSQIIFLMAAVCLYN